MLRVAAARAVARTLAPASVRAARPRARDARSGAVSSRGRLARRERRRARDKTRAVLRTPHAVERRRATARDMRRMVRRGAETRCRSTRRCTSTRIATRWRSRRRARRCSCRRRSTRTPTSSCERSRGTFAEERACVVHVASNGGFIFAGNLMLKAANGDATARTIFERTRGRRVRLRPWEFAARISWRGRSRLSLEARARRASQRRISRCLRRGC